MTDLSNLHAQVAILAYIKQKRAELAELEADAKAAVQDALGDDDTGTVDGHVVITWKTHKRTALDQKLLKKIHPDVAAECETTTEVRRFEVYG